RVERDVVGQVRHVGAETVDAGEPVAEQRFAHQLLERAAEKLHTRYKPEDLLVELAFGDRVLAAAELAQAGTDVGQAGQPGVESRSGEVRIVEVEHDLRVRATA